MGLICVCILTGQVASFGQAALARLFDNDRRPLQSPAENQINIFRLREGRWREPIGKVQYLMTR
jgi:hypothetical protein